MLFAGCNDALALEYSSVSKNSEDALEDFEQRLKDHQAVKRCNPRVRAFSGSVMHVVQCWTRCTDAMILIYAFTAKDCLDEFPVIAKNGASCKPEQLPLSMRQICSLLLRRLYLRFLLRENLFTSV